MPGYGGIRANLLARNDWRALSQAVGRVPGYYDLPGARMLVGGRLAASPDYAGRARSFSGIDVPAASLNQTEMGGAGFDPASLGNPPAGGGGEPQVYAPGGVQPVPLPPGPYEPPPWVRPYIPGVAPAEPVEGERGMPPVGNQGVSAYPYIDPRSANAAAFGLAEWNRGAGTTPNIRDPEFAGGALLERLMGLSRGGGGGRFRPARAQ